MNLDLTQEETKYLQELLECDHEHTRHELHYTDSREYRQMLKRKLEIISELTSRLVVEAGQA